MKTTYKLLVFISIIFIYSCNPDTNENLQNEKGISGNLGKQIKLGKKLKNPYSIKNMQKALDTILVDIKKARRRGNIQGRQSSEEIKIKTTDLYVRFLPKDSLELNSLKKDTTLVFYNHPLDYEITKKGTFYHDPDSKR